jgi:alkanesulfonate monooxygenase SsuD/methylene tetrahydromethanopterin reductase-like flavin-dependent oxidoreductase (luciferase family)
MRIWLNIGYSGKKAVAPVELIRLSEAVGFDSVWVAEAYGSDAVSIASWVLAQTTRIRVGTAIMQMPARTPANAAMTAMTLAQLGNRFRSGWRSGAAGIGAGMVAVTRMREYIQIMRLIKE